MVKMGNVMSYFAFPWGDPKEGPVNLKGISFKRGNAGKLLHERWRKERKKRKGFADRDHPFRIQGEGKAYTYKLFLEHSNALLKDGGRFGLIVPSGIYTDKGTTDMRNHFINNCKWEWLFGFENKKAIFDIHRSFKFCPIIIEKGSVTESIKATFMRHELSDWENPFDKVLDYSRSQVTKFSPKSKAILEIRTERDLEILDKIYSNSVLLGDQSPDGWQIKYAQGDFNMTSDSHLFPPRSWWEEKGYKPDQYGRWLPPEGEKPKLIYKGKEIGPPGDIGLPLYEGRMIGQFDFSNKGWVSGKGRTAVWRDIPWEEKKIEPQFIMPYHQCKINNILSYKLPILNISSATNSRTVICSFLKNMPCNHSLNPSRLRSLTNTLLMQTILNSYVYDYQVRLKLGGLNLSFFVLDETYVINKKRFSNNLNLAFFSARLSLGHFLFAPEWLYLIKYRNVNMKSLLALTNNERLRIRCIVDSIISFLFGLNYNDLNILVRNDPSDPKGFWRVDKDKPQELRHTTLTLVAFRDLEKMIEEHGGDVEKGIQAFCEQNDGEGWMIPEKIRFIQREDGTLDFDTPDSVEYEVRSKLGPRFYDWQLEGTPEESWKECEMHARNILGDEEFEKFMDEVKNDSQPYKSTIIKLEKHNATEEKQYSLNDFGD